MRYNDIDKRKTAFIFEFDNVLYPEKDYLYQVYYLFASILEYTELFNAHETTDLLINTYITKGKDFVFDELKEKLKVEEKYRQNLDELLINAKLPLKLLLYKNMLSLLQDIIIDRKKIFIVTNGKTEQQLNKIKQTEWHGLESYLICYFANESAPKPNTNCMDLIINDHNLQTRDLVIIENSETDILFAQACGIDFINFSQFL